MRPWSSLEATAEVVEGEDFAGGGHALRAQSLITCALGKFEQFFGEAPGLRDECALRAHETHVSCLEPPVELVGLAREHVEPELFDSWRELAYRVVDLVDFGVVAHKRLQVSLRSSAF